MIRSVSDPSPEREMYFCVVWMLNTWHPKLKHSIGLLFALLSAWPFTPVESLTTAVTVDPRQTVILCALELRNSASTMLPVIEWMTFALLVLLLLLPVVLILLSGFACRQVGPGGAGEGSLGQAATLSPHAQRGPPVERANGVAGVVCHERPFRNIHRL